MTAPRVIDPRSTANATLAVAEQTELLVVGGGPAGLAAATEAARRGIAVVLIDENPVAPETMGDDVPLHFGQRMSGAVRNRTAMTEAMLDSEPALAEALEAGVDVRLGSIVWGLYANGPSVAWLPGRVAGLSDGSTSGMLGFRAAIVASGRRDMGLAFPGWQLPGVMGATAAARLATRYGALAARRAVVLGTTAEALLAAQAMREAGVEVAAIVEQAEAPVAPLPEGLAGVPLLTRHVIAAAEGDSGRDSGGDSGRDSGRDSGGDAGGVAAAVLVKLDAQGQRLPGGTVIACDTIVLGVGSVPVIELLDALGCRIGFVPERAGHVPVTDAWGMTSLPGIYAVGDCAGVWADKSTDRTVAEAEGRRAAEHAAGFLAGTAPEAAPAPAAPPAAPQPAAPQPAAPGLSEYRLAWVRAAVIDAAVTDAASRAAEAHVCQCEEVTAREILEVRPPRYLGWERPLRNSAELSALLGNGPPNPDQVKRLTRAGMGLCQGRRCREQVACLLALGAGVGLGEVPPATHRAPVRPIPLGLAGTLPESADMAAHWDVWFGIPGQVTAYWDIPSGESP
jgi:NADPH-dependent 2,4-dienoyl-CoA reductase/sulfur reductase-like enzyme